MNNKSREKALLFQRSLKSMIEQHKIKKCDFAKELNISRIALYHWFDGSSIMSLETYFKIQEYFLNLKD